MFFPPLPADDAKAEGEAQGADLAVTAAAAAAPAQPSPHAPSPAQQAADNAASSSSDDDSDEDEDDGEGEEDIFGESVMGQLADSLRAALQARAGGREASPSPPPDRVRKRDQLGGAEALKWQPEIKVPEQKQPVRVHPGAGADKEKGLAKQVGSWIPSSALVCPRVCPVRCVGVCRGVQPGKGQHARTVIDACLALFVAKRGTSVFSRTWGRLGAALVAMPQPDRLTTGVLRGQQPQWQLPVVAGTAVIIWVLLLHHTDSGTTLWPTAFSSTPDRMPSLCSKHTSCQQRTCSSARHLQQHQHKISSRDPTCTLRTGP